MGESDADDPISDDELLLRRIPASQNWVSRDRQSVDPLAFRPTERDTNGLSFGRAKFETTADEAAKGAQGKQFFVAVLSASRIRAVGIQIVPKPLPDDPGHSEIPELTFANRRNDRARELVQHLCDCAIQRRAGPYMIHSMPATNLS